MENQKLIAEEPQTKKVFDIFTLVKPEDGTVKITIGNYLITPKTFKTMKAAEDYLEKKPYDILINMMCLAYQQLRKEEENEKQTKRTTEAAK